MEIPKISALNTALRLSSDPCEKNATVIGIIGNTHGVSTPANPASSEIRKNLSNPLSVLIGSESPTGSVLLLIT
jgi:hypothetical protein